MSNNTTNSAHPLAEPAAILRASLPLADRLSKEGVIIELSPEEHAQLLKFEKLVEADYSDNDWSYLRVVSGVKVAGVAALNSCLRLYRAKQPKTP